jgi:hypothetical protein
MGRIVGSHLNAVANAKAVQVPARLVADINCVVAHLIQDCGYRMGWVSHRMVATCL